MSSGFASTNPETRRGAPEVKSNSVDRVACIALMRMFIERERKGHNNANILEFEVFTKGLIFNQLIGFSGGDIFEFLRRPAGPFDDQAVDVVGFANAEGQSEFGLR